MSVVRTFLKHVRTTGKRRVGVVKTVAMGREHAFDAYDIGDDTFIFERGISRHLDSRPSVLVVPKGALRRRQRGWVMTLATGNHAVAAFPLLDGRFWGLSRLASNTRSETLAHAIVCANVVGGRLEVSQREIATPRLVAADDWLMRTAGFGMDGVTLLERNEVTLEYYRRVGQEWRVKPLAWTAGEMRTALAASRKQIATCLTYYHSVRGVHLLSFAEFARFAALARSDRAAFVAGLRELVALYEGNAVSFTRMPKHRGHHEIEFFGLRRGVALERLIPELERLMEAIALDRILPDDIVTRIGEIEQLYASLLTSPDLADEQSRTFVETIYMYLTGEIYAVEGEGSTPAFDDRRTALPGATFHEGRATLHPGADARTEILLENLRGLMSKDEIIEYANVYELRERDSEQRVGAGATREIVYKTNRRPVENALIEKRLSRARQGYAGYMLARIGVLRALGVGLSEYYMMLRRRPCLGKRPCDHYIRRRCEGEPMEAIPANYFRNAGDASAEDRDVVLGLATLMGDAAAQNMAMMKFDSRTQSPLYGVGKEIYEFEYDIVRKRVLPKKVTTCSIRGSLGWPCLKRTDDNLRAIYSFYLTHYAHALKDFQRRHSVPMADLAERFIDGFEFRTHALAWHLSVMRDRFEAFDPDVPSGYGFARRWRFAMWSLKRQEEDVALIRQSFFEKVRVVEGEAGVP